MIQSYANVICPISGFQYQYRSVEYEYVDRALDVISSGVKNINLMKTANSGFTGFIQDKYTNLVPVGTDDSQVERIMCTRIDASWRFVPGQVHAKLNHLILQSLFHIFHGQEPNGVYSKSLQETAYRMCLHILQTFPEVDEVKLITPNVHYYCYPLEQFDLKNPNVVFQSTDPDTSASGRIITELTRSKL